jgi:hypothetical protein
VYISNVHLINLGKRVDTSKILEEWRKNWFYKWVYRNKYN